MLLGLACSPSRDASLSRPTLSACPPHSPPLHPFYSLVLPTTYQSVMLPYVLVALVGSENQASSAILKVSSLRQDRVDAGVGGSVVVIDVAVVVVVDVVVDGVVVVVTAIFVGGVLRQSICRWGYRWGHRWGYRCHELINNMYLER